MTDTLEHVIDIALDRLAAHPRNVRRAPGDLEDLTRSIRDRGVETPLVVLPADGAGIHHIVAGHRRRAAAEAVGLATVPCIVRDFSDEADVVLCDDRREHPALRRPEHRRRSPGARRRDRPARRHRVGPQARRRRRATARAGSAPASPCSRSPTRRSTPCTPGTITIDVATALTAVADHPDLVEELVANHRADGVAGRVRPSHPAHRPRRRRRQQRPRRSRSVSRRRGRLAGEPARRGRPSTTSASTPTAHRSEPCHAVVVKCRYDATVVEIPICTEPRRHRGRKPDSERRRGARRAHRGRRGRHRRATRTSTERPTPAPRWVSERLGGRPLPASEAVPLAVLTWIDSAPYAAAQQATAAARDRGTRRRLRRPRRLLLEHISTAEPKRLAAVAVALVAATAEERARQSLALGRPSPATSTPSNASATNPPTGNTPNASPAA